MYDSIPVSGGGTTLYIEVPYVNRTILEKQFYAFYHEHVSYFSVTTLKYLLDKFNLEITDVKENFLGGGSVLIQARYKGNYNIETFPIVKQYLDFEKSTISSESLLRFSSVINTSIKDLSNMIQSLAKDGTIAAWGAGQRGCTLINLCKCSRSDIRYVIDANKNYWWKYVNGTDIQIVPPKYYKQVHVDKIIIFSTGYADSIIENNWDFTNEGGEFIKII